MTIEELREGLLAIVHAPGSEDDDHIKADELLLQYIDDHKVTDAYNKINKWYS